MEYLSNIELYYSPERLNELIIIREDEYKHIVFVMRHKTGDELFITDGKGKIYQTEIVEICKKEVFSKIKKEYIYEKKLSNFTFCIPKLKNTDRFDFAIEKCVELGITDFVVYDSDRGIKKGNKPERWIKIAISAMKQSLQSYLPQVRTVKKIDEILSEKGEVIVFEQNSEVRIEELKIETGKKYYVLFGPEGGLSKRETELLSRLSQYKLIENRLRSETAIITAAVKLNSLE